MRKTAIVLATVLLGLPIFAQTDGEKAPFKIEMHGFIGLSMFMDSRQSINLRHNQINMYPKQEVLDANGNDLNATGMRSFDASHSRIGFFVSGPDVLGAKSSAVLEGDFLGGSGANDVNFRIRQANVKLQWERSYLLLGQAYHPLFVVENYPNTQVFSAGVPFHPLNRAPQVQIGTNLSDLWAISGYILGQNDFRSVGMTSGYEQSMVPEFAARVRFQSNKGFFAVLNGGVQTQKPDLVVPVGINQGFKSDKHLVSTYFSGSLRQSFEKTTLKAGFVYGGNMTSQVMIGGVARHIKQNGDFDYVALRSMSLWYDMDVKTGTKWSLGLFAGYSANLGASKEASAVSALSRGENIGELYAVSPRIYFHASTKMWMGVEYTANTAQYGATFDKYAKPIELKSVTNHRIGLHMRYMF